MRILALETSQQSGSIALLDADQLAWQKDLPTGQRTAQTLAPAIREALEHLGWSSRDVGLVAVSSGPGSFTGLRIGVTTAKVFAYAAGSAIIDLNTLDVIAAQCPSHQPPIAAAPELWAVMDAQRGELFAARYRADGSGWWNTDTPTCVVSRGTWCSQLHPQAAVTGPGLRGFETCLAATGNPGLATRLPPTLCVASPERWAPRAETVGRLAFRRYEAGQRNDVWHVLPQYFRPSAAEEKAR